MVKPKKEGAAWRRVATISLYAGAWLLLTLLAPAWVPLAFVIGLVRRRSMVILRLMCFAWFYFGFELFALTLVGLQWARFRHEPVRCQERMTALQTWWASIVLSVASGLLELEVDVEGAESARPGPAIILVRHASILDTLIPCVYLQRPTHWKVRYILKQELLIDPCLDIVGHLLPNYFVNRTGHTPSELAGIRRLVADLGDDGVLIFPEGTRYSEHKRERELARIASDAPEYAARARALMRVLPPKPGGVLALLDALPGVDCVFVAHTGLESFAKIKDLLSGDVVRSTLRIWVWRVPGATIPSTPTERLGWLYEQWGSVSALVSGSHASR